MIYWIIGAWEARPAIDRTISYIYILTWYLTARPGDNLRCVYDTYDWIAKYCLPYDGIAFSSEKFRWCARSQYYKHIEYAIDDSPKHALEYAKHGIECHVPIKSYNKQTQSVNNIKRYKIF